ncbi:hypothetical protein K432DRAFT_415520 [Lepidopterella palustris CBS 459.81]|uniref:Uncharacterized protein n=1 Tax=Lepidopterella palustris CBS 459.81 TaxID=1314670 RepID=A0A8E2EE47_9PEZI|nr:hypothetical protein K432DRAFT_415520 [Lepidopterella palustris CBS 459.81]
MDLRPSTAVQHLHRDDRTHHALHGVATSYHANRDILLGLFVSACDTTRPNDTTRKPDFGENGNRGIVDAELKAGEAFTMLGNLYCGVTMRVMFCCSGIYTQEEISYLSYTAEDVKDSEHVQLRRG